MTSSTRAKILASATTPISGGTFAHAFAVGAVALVFGAASAHAQNAQTLSGQSSLGVTQTNNIGVTLTPTVSGAGSITQNNVSSSTLTVGSSLVDRNVASASGTGNEASLTVTATINNDTATAITTAIAVAGGTNDVDAETAVGTSQLNDGVTANVDTNQGLGITADAVAGSTLRVRSNLQEAIGILNRATNVVTTSVNDTNSTTGIGNTQVNGASSMSVDTASTASITVNSDTANGGLATSTAELMGNSQRAIAQGNLATNTQSLTGNNVTLAANAAGEASTSGTLAETTGGYVTSSRQQLNSTPGSTITATASNGFTASVSDNVTNSTVRNESNAGVASVRGNDVTSAITVTANSLATSDGTKNEPGTVAAIGSSQAITNYDLTATAYAQAPAFALTTVETDVNSSTVSTSSNAASAFVTGNMGSNGITANIGDLNTAETTPAAAIDGSANIVATADTVAVGAFVVSSTQSVDTNSALSATLTDNVTPVGANVRNNIGGDVLTSTVLANSNAMTAAATGNLITAGSNSITLTGTNVATTTAVANRQTLDGDVSATINPGVDQLGGTAGQSATTLAANGNYSNPTNFVTSVVAGTEIVLSGPAVFTGLTLSQRAQDVLIAAGATGVTGTGFTLPAGTYDNTLFAGINGSSVPGSNQFVFTGILLPVINAVPGIDLPRGVITSIGDDITNSTVRVDGNSSTGSVLGNSATNRISVMATNLDAGAPGGDKNATADPDLANTAGTVDATANNALTNTQAIGVDSALTSSVTGAYGIATLANGTDSAVTDSTLSASSNAQSADTTGNAVNNSIMLGSGNVESTAAIMSVQSSLADVGADSTMTVFAPAANTDSTLRLNGNSNAASATVNSAGNSLTVSASSLTSADAVDASLDTSTEANKASLGSGDYVLSNAQRAETTVDTTASTVVTNWDSDAMRVDVTPFPTDGILRSTVEASRNTTDASSLGNVSVNSVSLTASNAMAATGALINDQSSTAAFNSAAGAGVADADADIVINVLGTAATSAVKSSTITLASNETLARSIANDTSNSVSASMGSFAAGVDAVVTSNTLNDANAVDADFALLNSQKSSVGGINAEADGLYTLTFAQATTSTVATIDGSTLRATGNATDVEARANRATNTVTVSASGSLGATGALLSDQVNSSVLDGKATTLVEVAVSNTAAANEVVGSSTIVVADNSSSNRVIANSATNSVTGSSLAAAGGGAADASLSTSAAPDNSATADFALLNRQDNSGSATALTNADYRVSVTANTATTADGVLSSTIEANRNVTNVEAQGNVASNTAALTGSNTLGASGGLLNSQANSGAVSGTAIVNVGVAITNATGASAGQALDSSTVNLANNVTSVRSGGNSATNTMTASTLNAAGTGNTVQDVALNSTGANTAGASLAVLNQQSNSAGIGATATASYTASYSNFATNNAVDNARVVLNGNSVGTVAFGNSAVNSLTLTALNAPTASAAIGNNQTNSGSVAALTNGVGFTSTATGSVTNSSVAVGGSNASATAVGNFAQSVLTRR